MRTKVLIGFVILAAFLAGGAAWNVDIISAIADESLKIKADSIVVHLHDDEAGHAAGWNPDGLAFEFLFDHVGPVPMTIADFYYDDDGTAPLAIEDCISGSTSIQIPEGSAFTCVIRADQTAVVTMPDDSTMLYVHFPFAPPDGSSLRMLIIK